ncbi:anti-sigma factor family protein [Cohnella caldifontis]|uniref:anti-sigma factor family protein n=1 Tax=Cohnella caldifontis TaxID=3027471 RepID=UPI0023EC3685|nr:zf-HC2 domain-containing protein [Cohnella sp. YIM B05605]
MNCEQVTEWLGIYRDLPEDSPERLAVDLHVAGCADCAEQFRLWEESAELIRGLPLDDDELERTWVSDSLNRQVMDRIYSEQAWYMPAARRTYAFSSGFRKKVAAVLAALLAVFCGSFLYTAWKHMTAGNDTPEVLDATGSLSSGFQTVDVPVASLSDVYALHVSPVMPEYWVALSLLGMIMMLLILNWFSRVRS